MSILKGSHGPAHESARAHVQGSAEYVDDRPREARELTVGLIWSPHAHARVLSIDVSRVQKWSGQLWIFDYKALAHNTWGSIFHDQEFLAQDVVHFVGEVVLVVAAEDPAILKAALQAIRIDYEVLPAILSIDAAVKQQSFIGVERKIERGDWEKGLATAPHRLQGTLQIDGADHFYLENQAAIAYPRDGGLIEVHSSTQHPTETQHLVAEALGLPQKDVVCIVKRLGGGFGGKETQAAPFAVYAALVARACQRPARLVLDKDTDMMITGKRNPFQIHYDIAFRDDGEIVALDAMLFSDGGACADLSTAIMERALTHADNAYFLPAVRLRGQVCRTHIHPHTAFRGFGGPKGVAMIEQALERIAHHLKMDSYDVRMRNVYRHPHRNTTPYGQLVEGDALPQLFETLAERCDYKARRQRILDEANPKSPALRGIALTAVKFGISFITRFLNQGNALVILHQDGSFQVSTGAVEMGQGVQTKIGSLVAREFGVTPDRVRIMPTQTDKNANTSATAASSGTDLNGAAALVACRPLKERLSKMFVALLDLDPELWPSRTIGPGTRPDLVWDKPLTQEIMFEGGRIFAKHQSERALTLLDVIREAYFNRVSLSEYGFYKVEGLDFNKVTGQGNAFLYYSQGVACSEVEVNRYTGEVKVLRTDILMDLGRPINYDLEVGQIRGAFIQGLGWVTTEQLVYDKGGRLLTHAPSTYKIPSIHDIPRDFRVDLLDTDEPKTLHRGKAVGEPPLLLCFSVWAAIMQAIRNPSLPIPASKERIMRSLYPDAFAAWENGS
ncbi:MAG TPA: molybdopterin cofactor-binding domain-containing protein [Oligoflexus sp.]|uniref:xanthine dehydrogenase molybdopterin binding subunit n=1 Tax=Oligoflexus sp. TaxID=1971216 RepID=UPI002D810D40|nr:molybdopterin cofactor-binding domain-containing protein [Oligoflexus sp.]HET9239494.1 molybdopterin cofactor-binding domain-containing protein [Oligoflexus sp.]